MKMTISWALIGALFTSCSERGADDRTGTPAQPDLQDTAGANATPAATGAGAAHDAPPARPLLNAVPIDGLPVIGARDALVTIVEFTDYDCPYCARAEQTIAALRDKYGADLRVAVAETPLPMHPHARPAALTALAAGESGDFAAVHAFLFAHPDAHADADLDRVGAALHLGRDYERARASEQPKTSLAVAAALAKSLHVTGTPTFFLNGRRVSGAQPLATFDAIASEELAHARELTAHGVGRRDVYDAVLTEARAHPAPLDDALAGDPPAFVPEARTAGGAHLYGRPNAAHPIVLFYDFECPYCAKLDARLRAFVDTHPDARVVLRHRPLPMHSHARLAAKAAIAAEAQGKLAPYAELLFDNQRALERDDLFAYAAKVGLDPARFARDLDAPETEQRLAADDALATKLEVRGTPTSFIEGHRIIGAQPDATFEEALAHCPRE